MKEVCPDFHQTVDLVQTDEHEVLELLMMGAAAAVAVYLVYLWLVLLGLLPVSTTCKLGAYICTCTCTVSGIPHPWFESPNN